jgi:hypothetical protein
MSERDDSDLYRFVEGVFNRVTVVANPVLERKLAGRGVALEALPLPEQLDLLKSSFAEATAEVELDAAHQQLKLIFDSLADPRFMEAIIRLRSAPLGAPFDPAQGRDAAIVLAGAGLVVAPMDRRTGRAIGPSARGIDEADAVFSKAKTAWVGYAPAQAPFYTVVTECLRTLFTALHHDDKFAGMTRTIHSAGGFPDQGNLPMGRRGMILVERKPEDRIACWSIQTPGLGAIVIAAGWMEGSEAKGVPGDGLAPAPAQLVRTLVQDPRVLPWLFAPVGGLLASAS